MSTKLLDGIDVTSGTFGRRVSEAGILALITALNVWVVGTAVFGRYFPPNDAKHWLVRARYFAGWPMPSSELVGQFATHPVAIVSLSILLALVGSAVVAAKLWAVLAFLWTTLAVYVTGRELFSPRVALVAFAFVSLGQHLYFDLLSFGGIPQLISVGFATLCVGALVRARRTGLPSDRVVFGALLLLGYLAHPPSSPVYVAAIGLGAVCLAVSSRRLDVVVDTVVDALVPSLLFAAYVASQWRIFSLYTSTTGGHDFGDLLIKLGRSELFWTLFVGVLVASPLLLYALRRDAVRAGLYVPTVERSPTAAGRADRTDSSGNRVDGTDDDGRGGHVGYDGGDVAATRRERLLSLFGGERPRQHFDADDLAALVFGWLLGLLFFAWVVSSIPGVSTELARLSFFIAAPLGIALALYLCLIGWLMARFLSGRRVGVTVSGETLERLLVVLVALAVIVPGFAWSTYYYDNSRNYYAIKNTDSVRSVVDWVDGQQPFGGTVAAPFYVATWVEGLTGQDALTSTPAGGSYRPSEKRESVAFEKLETLRWEGDTPQNVAAAKAVLREYDVRYVVVPNNWRQTRFESLGQVVFTTEKLVVVEVDPSIRNAAGGSASSRVAGEDSGSNVADSGDRYLVASGRDTAVDENAIRERATVAERATRVG